MRDVREMLRQLEKTHAEYLHGKNSGCPCVVENNHNACAMATEINRLKKLLEKIK